MRDSRSFSDAFSLSFTATHNCSFSITFISIFALILHGACYFYGSSLISLFRSFRVYTYESVSIFTVLDLCVEIVENDTQARNFRALIDARTWRWALRMVALSTISTICSIAESLDQKVNTLGTPCDRGKSAYRVSWCHI